MYRQSEAGAADLQPRRERKRRQGRRQKTRSERKETTLTELSTPAPPHTWRSGDLSAHEVEKKIKKKKKKKRRRDNVRNEESIKRDASTSMHRQIGT